MPTYPINDNASPSNDHEHLGNIRLPAGQGGPALVTVFERRRRGKPVRLQRYLAELLLILNQRYREDRARGVAPSEMPGLISYRKLAQLLTARRLDRKVKPESLRSFVCRLKKELNESMRDRETPVIAYIRQCGPRLLGEFDVTDETDGEWPGEP
jgi:hypothetical protein